MQTSQIIFVVIFLAGAAAILACVYAFLVLLDFISDRYPRLYRYIRFLPRAVAMLLPINLVYTSVADMLFGDNSNKTPIDIVIIVIAALMALCLVFARGASSWVLFMILIFAAGGEDNGRKMMRSPLQFAVEANDMEKAKAALEKGVSQETKNRSFRRAVDDEHLEIAKLLLDGGAQVNQKEFGGETPLMELANRNGSVASASFLLAHGADINARDDRGATALIYAASFSDPDIVHLLLDNGADASLSNSAGETALMIAERDRRVSNTKILQDAAWNVHTHSQ